MRCPVGLFGFFLLLVTSVSAEEVYVTASGETTSTFEVFQDCDVCLEVIVLPLGEFQMGSSVQEANDAQLRFQLNWFSDISDYQSKLRQSFINLGIDPDQPEEGLRRYYAGGSINREEDPQYSANPFLHEVPRHQVTIDQPIAMGRHEITREEWFACVEDGGCERGQRDVPVSAYIACEKEPDCVATPDSRVAFRLQKNPPRADHPRSPMTGLTYYEMNDYTSWLNDRIGAKVYRIPTEAEWEFAARAGTTTKYAQGDSLTLDLANFMINRIEIVDGKPVWKFDMGSAGDLLPVDDLDAANDWGLRHMSGNAAEFTSTCGEGPHRGLATSSQYLAADADRID